MNTDTLNVSGPLEDEEEPEKFGLLTSEERLGPDMTKLYRSEKWTDVTLIVQSKMFKAHRAILSARCAYFKSLFESAPNTLVFEMDSSFSPDAFDIILEFLYGGKIIIKPKEIDDLVEISIKLGLKGLISDLSVYIGVTLNNQNVFAELQTYYGKNPAVFENCLLYLDHHITDVQHSSELLNMPYEIMKEIIKRETLGVEENQLVRILEEWYRENLRKNDGNTVKMQVKELAKHLKLYLINPEVFFQTIKPLEWIEVEKLWEVLAEMIAARGRYPPMDESEPKFRRRKPGPKELPKRNPKPKPANLAKKDFKVAMLGLEGSGKTTALYKLKLGEVVTTVPTIGFNLEVVEYKGERMEITEFGGKVKENWFSLLSKHTDALIWVIDSTQVNGISIMEDIQNVFVFIDNYEIPVLIFASKQDLPSAISPVQIIESLRISDSGIKRWFIQPCCSTGGDGLYEGIDWLHSQLAGSDL